MEEKMITIRCYNAATNEYYDKKIPYVEPEEVIEITQDDITDMILDLQEQIILLELGE